MFSLDLLFVQKVLKKKKTFYVYRTEIIKRVMLLWSVINIFRFQWKIIFPNFPLYGKQH